MLQGSIVKVGTGGIIVQCPFALMVVLTVNVLRQIFAGRQDPFLTIFAHFSCDPGWHGNRCEFCKPTDECPKPYYDRQGQRCKCPRYKPDIPGPSFENDLKRVDEEYRRRIRENDSTYLTLSVLIVVLLVICALLLVVVVGLTLRNSDFSFSCPKSAKLRRKTQPTESTPAPNIISV